MSDTPKRRQFGAIAHLFLAVAALAFWQGGLSFYAIVVVPVGNSILQNGEQGFITQQVTTWLNVSGIAAIALLAVNAQRLRNRSLWIVCAVLIVTLAMLFAIHLKMDALLLPASFDVVDRKQFSLWHDAYLTVVTVQWCAALAALWMLLKPLAVE